MTLTTALIFAFMALVTIATPGPTVLLAMNNGSRHGIRRALAGVWGAVASDGVLVGAVALGLGALLAASEFWFSVIKWLGVGYLAFLGLTLLRSRRSPDDLAAPPGGQGGSTDARSLFLKSFLVAATNPKGYLFFSALLPQFIDPAAAQWPQYVALALIFASIDFVVMLAYAGLGSRAAQLLGKAGLRWVDRASGGLLLALAAVLAGYRRATP